MLCVGDARWRHPQAAALQARAWLEALSLLHGSLAAIIAAAATLLFLLLLPLAGRAALARCRAALGVHTLCLHARSSGRLFLLDGCSSRERARGERARRWESSGGRVGGRVGPGQLQQALPRLRLREGEAGGAEHTAGGHPTNPLHRLPMQFPQPWQLDKADCKHAPPGLLRAAQPRAQPTMPLESPCPGKPLGKAGKRCASRVGPGPTCDVGRQRLVLQQREGHALAHHRHAAVLVRQLAVLQPPRG